MPLTEGAERGFGSWGGGFTVRPRPLSPCGACAVRGDHLPCWLAAPFLDSVPEATAGLKGQHRPSCGGRLEQTQAVNAPPADRATSASCGVVSCDHSSRPNRHSRRRDRPDAESHPVSGLGGDCSGRGDGAPRCPKPLHQVAVVASETRTRRTVKTRAQSPCVHACRRHGAGQRHVHVSHVPWAR